MRLSLLLFFLLLSAHVLAQYGYGNQWIFGRFYDPQPSGTLLDFGGGSLHVTPFNKRMELEASCTVMCDSAGKLLFYSNGCYIANATHQTMENGHDIGRGKLKTSFCNTGGNPMTQGIIALPKPASKHLYYLFYTDIEEPYTPTPFFPLAPVTLYYSVIDMSLQNGLGAVTEKNQIALRDTLALGMMQANRHANGEDWWLIMPKSHSNCYWTLLLTEHGIDTVFKQCIGPIWNDYDNNGQAVFSPNAKKYVRFNYFYGLNLFDFDHRMGLLSNPETIGFGQDTFYFNGAAFSSNSRFIYAPCFKTLWQFDTWASDISESRILIGELNTNVPIRTRFSQARLAPDGKIYIGGTVTFKHLHVINRPNCLGTDCDLQQYAVPLASNCTFTMPNMPHYKPWSESDSCETVGTALPKGNLKPPSIRFYPNPTQGHLMAEGLEAGDEIEWVDVSGRAVKTAIWQPSARLDVSGIKEGFYLLKVSRNGRRVGVFKVVKE